MKRTFFQRFIASAVLIGAVLGTASVAQARADVYVSIGVVGMPGFPVLMAPPLPRPIIRVEPIYVQPRPVYVAPPVVVYQHPWQSSYRNEVGRDMEWRHREWQRREWERRHHHQRDRSPQKDRHGRD